MTTLELGIEAPSVDHARAFARNRIKGQHPEARVSIVRHRVIEAADPRQVGRHRFGRYVVEMRVAP